MNPRDPLGYVSHLESLGKNDIINLIVMISWFVVHVYINIYIYICMCVFVVCIHIQRNVFKVYRIDDQYNVAKWGPYFVIFCP